jgi:hypothetical protein
MADNPRTPLAILLGSVIIATGVYFGLRESRPVAQPQPRVAAGPELFGRVKEGALRGLEARRQPMASTCAAGLKDKVELTFSLAFDANGREIGRGISQTHRGPSEPDPVARCLREHFPPELRIDPPQTTVSVTVQFALP